MSLENLSLSESNQRFAKVNQKINYRPNTNTFPRLCDYEEDKIDINQRRQVISASQDIIPKYSHIVNKPEESKKRRMERRVHGYDKEIIKNNLYSLEVTSLSFKPIIPRSSIPNTLNPLEVCTSPNNKLELRPEIRCSENKNPLRN